MMHTYAFIFYMTYHGVWICANNNNLIALAKNLCSSLHGKINFSCAVEAMNLTLLRKQSNCWNAELKTENCRHHWLWHNEEKTEMESIRIHVCTRAVFIMLLASLKLKTLETAIVIGRNASMPEKNGPPSVLFTFIVLGQGSLSITFTR